ncbi:MAG TPA: Fe(2+) transporter permease subunit FeoB [Pseudomonadales bacterium]|nr:Fe(2+) transporter permease subunit FeoB [Pseudomonadales bacterium]
MTTVALIGNPNAGKTTVFNALTGSHQRVGNWPGVTVERKSGYFRHGDARLEVVDLPGIYSLLAVNATDAQDSRIARDFLLDAEIDVIVNVVDAASLARGLYLTAELLDLDTPVIVALNMMDVADRHGMHIDPYKLGVSIGAPVVPLVASRNEGIGTLKDVIESVAGNTAVRDSGSERKRGIALTHVLESTLATVSRELAEQGVARHRRFVAAALLEGDEAVASRVGRIGRLASVAASGETLSVARYHAIDALLEQALRRTAVRRTITDMLDSVFLNRVLAFPLFLGVMYLMFMFTINIGSAFIDFFDLSGMALFVEGPRHIYAWLGLPVWLSTFLADGIGGGVRLVSTFIPVIACLFLFLSFLEDSGYMGRAAFIVDRLMRRVGLPGKSFVPLIVGFGCNVPAVMATRTLDSEHDRVLTTLMAPYMSCGARLTVYALFAVAFFPTNGQNLVFALYLLGIGVAVMSALIVRRYLLPRASSTFVMELPAYHMPTLRGLFMHTWQRLKGFVLRAGKAIVTVVVVLNLVSTVGTDGSVGNENTNKSVLSAIGRALTPGFGPMGIATDNWPATVGIFTGVFAKEVVVGTLNALYENLDGVTEAKEQFDFWGTLQSAAASVPTNLGALANRVADPLGLDLGDLGDTAAQAQQQNVAMSTIQQMQRLFATSLAAFAYLVFILLYMPCAATIGAIYKELGAFWATFSTTWSLVTAYCFAVIVFQIGSFAAAPTSAALAIALAIAGLAGSFAALIRWGRTRVDRSRLIPLVNIT